MKDYTIVTDSSCDLPVDILNKYNISTLPLITTMDGKDYVNYMDERQITNKEFYRLLRLGKKATTSQVTVEKYIEEFTRIVEEGKDVLYISFSSALSGCFNSSNIAACEVLEKYPDAHIICVDSKCASMGQGLLITYCAMKKEEGKTLEEVSKFAEDTRDKLCHLFTVGDLGFLRRGGRISYMKALLGTALKVKPLLHVDLEGRLIQTGKTRGRKQSLDLLIQRMKETIENPENQIVYISHGDSVEDAEYCKKQIMESMPIKEVVINYVGVVIGSHSGPDTIAIFYLGTDKAS